MFLIPFPQKLIKKDGMFRITPEVNILLDISCDYEDFEAARLLRDEIADITGMQLSIKKGPAGLDRLSQASPGLIVLVREDTAKLEGGKAYTAKQEDRKADATEAEEGKANDGKTWIDSNGRKDFREAYRLSIGEELILITGFSAVGLLYGVQTLRQIVRNDSTGLPCMDIEDRPDFENRGFYHDITRGRIPKLETLMELADRLSFYKINQLQLYMEHSFAFQGHSEIWADSDPVTAEEILILDEYCRKKGIELVPSIATFGHLYHALVSKSFRHLNEYEDLPESKFTWVDRMQHHTLDASNPQSFEFIRRMIDEFLPLFSSDKFNLGCDETNDLGRGKNSSLAGEIGTGRLYLYFVKKLIRHVKGCGKKVMMWGDILLKYPEVLNELPEDIILLNWGYSPEISEDSTKTIAEAGLSQYACPGVQGWNRLVNHMDHANRNISAMVSYAVKYHASGILNTDWGDFGHINLLANSIPGILYGAGLSWNSGSGGGQERGESGTGCSEGNRIYNETGIMGRPSDAPMGRPSDEAISLLEYGDRSGRLVGLLRKLSRQTILDWETAVLWYYRTTGSNVDVYGYDNYYLNLMSNSEEDSIKASYAKIGELQREIAAHHSDVYPERKQDVREFLVSADGLALFQSLLLVIKKNSLGQKDTGLIHGPKELAEKLERWFSDYKKVWRERNRESELYRIKDFIMGVCRLLREW